jgi:hypothetical protein
MPCAAQGVNGPDDDNASSLKIATNCLAISNELLGVFSYKQT